jgi:hypothetical protein
VLEHFVMSPEWRLMDVALFNSNFVIAITHVQRTQIVSRI